MFGEEKAKFVDFGEQCFAKLHPSNMQFIDTVAIYVHSSPGHTFCQMLNPGHFNKLLLPLYMYTVLS